METEAISGVRRLDISREQSEHSSDDAWKKLFYSETLSLVNHIDGMMMATFSFSFAALSAHFVIYSNIGAGDITKNNLALILHFSAVFIGMMCVLLIRRLTQNHSALVFFGQKIENDSRLADLGPIAWLVREVAEKKTKALKTYRLYILILATVTSAHVALLWLVWDANPSSG